MLGCAQLMMCVKINTSTLKDVVVLTLNSFKSFFYNVEYCQILDTRAWGAVADVILREKYVAVCSSFFEG